MSGRDEMSLKMKAALLDKALFAALEYPPGKQHGARFPLAAEQVAGGLRFSGQATASVSACTVTIYDAAEGGVAIGSQFLGNVAHGDQVSLDLIFG